MSTDERSPRTIRLLTAVLLVGTFAAGTVTGAAIYDFARRDRRGAPPVPPPFLSPRVLDELHLTPEQKKKAYDLAEARRPDIEDILR